MSQPIEHLEQLPDHEHIIGFCYKITNLTTGTFYIGKKNIRTVRKKALPTHKRSLDRRRKTYLHIERESDWKQYYGSSEALKSDVARLGKTYFQREILELACSSKYLSYLELKYQFYYNVLERPGYNKNILGRFFTRDIEGSPFCLL